MAVLHAGDVIAMQPGDWIVSYFGLEFPDRLEKNMGEWAGPLEPPRDRWCFAFLNAWWLSGWQSKF